MIVYKHLALFFVVIFLIQFYKKNFKSAHLECVRCYKFSVCVDIVYFVRKFLFPKILLVVEVERLNIVLNKKSN